MMLSSVAALILAVPLIRYVVLPPDPAAPRQDDVLPWLTELEAGLAKGRAAGRPVVVLVVDESAECASTVKAFEDPAIRKLAPQFVWVKLRAGSVGASSLRCRIPSILIVEPMIRPADPAESQEGIQFKIDSMRFTFDFADEPLTSVVDFLRDATGLNVMVDRSAGDLSKKRVSIKVSDTPFAVLLKTVLVPNELDYLVQDGLIRIGAPGALQDLKRPANVIAAAPLMARVPGTQKKLESMKIDVNYSDEPLENIFQYFAEYSSLKFTIDRGLDLKKTFTIKFRGLTLHEALTVILEQFDSVHTILNDGSVFVASKGIKPPGGCRAWEAKEIRDLLDPFGEPQDTDLSSVDRESIQRALADLSSDKFQVRETAQKSLKDMGIRARRMIRAALEKTRDPEVRKRLSFVLQGSR